MAEKKEFAILKIKDKEYKLPIEHGTIGPDAIDISKLYAESGYFTYDPGFMSTASCKSSITYIDGDAGILRHRGYDIDYLCNKYDYEDVSYLLLYGKLPNKLEKKDYHESMNQHYLVHEQLQTLFKGFKRDSHPMAIMVGAVGSLSAFYHDTLDIKDPKQREAAIYRIIAKVNTLACMAYRYTIGHSCAIPKSKYSYAQNLLHMMFSTPMEEYKMHSEVVDAINKLLILHADHEQNASTSTVRIAGSSGANPFAVISSGIASLWGPLHGGANEAVIKMLKEIGTPDRIPHFIARAKDKNDDYRLSGFGHRVYKNYDPRAKVLKKACISMLKILKIKDPLLEIAQKLEEIALNDEYFIERKLFPNVDFYSGIIYKALGIPTKMFTVMFAVARTVGWISQWKEMIEDPATKINRPRQIYIGDVKKR